MPGDTGPLGPPLISIASDVTGVVLNPDPWRHVIHAVPVSLIVHIICAPIYGVILHADLHTIYQIHLLGHLLLVRSTQATSL